jgi:hypothetical protein
MPWSIYYKRIPAPKLTLKPSTASLIALTTCGLVSNILGHTKFNKWIKASSHPNPYTPNARCFTADAAVYRCTKSLSVKASSSSGVTA